MVTTPHGLALVVVWINRDSTAAARALRCLG